MKQGTREWVAYAEHDYEAALMLAEAPNPPFEIVAYHCQQAAEKYLKAVLIEHEQPVLFIHDLGKLNQECCKVFPAMAEIQDACEHLTPFGTITRYPGSGMIVEVEHMPIVVSLVQ
ncbi:MAG: HEPN domain-containing protein [Spirochaetales bacterium]|jgi:HEPN domain-containing protein|nr:HEPN domain-containing protein [Spirochaetales bacterium]